jgi:hypothetical protein
MLNIEPRATYIRWDRTICTKSTNVLQDRCIYFEKLLHVKLNPNAYNRLKA